MSVSDGQCASTRSNDPETTVLVLTDGSKRAARVAEWGLVFAEATRTMVHRIDVIECLDSGVIIHQHDRGMQDGGKQLSRTPTSAAIDRLMPRTQRGEPATDVLHGIPHEAILEYVAVNAINPLIISVRDRTHLSQSFLGRTFIKVSHAATVPVITIDGIDELYDPLCDECDLSR